MSGESQRAVERSDIPPPGKTRVEHVVTYAEAGVDVEAGDKAVELMKDAIRRAQRPEVLGGLGGFAGLFDATRLTRMTRPVLATSTDGVGTKVAIAQALDKHDTIGYDLVGMVVDDIVVCGAEPLFMTDYIATGKVVPERIAEIVGGIAERLRGDEHRPHRRRDGRAPRTARPRRVRRGRRRDGRRRVRRPSRPASRHSPETSSWRSRRADCTPTGTRWSAASSSPPAGASTGTSTSSEGRSARSSSNRPASTRDPSSTSSTRSTSTPSATSPVAGSPPTSPGSCHQAPWPRSTAAPGRRRPIFTTVQRLGRVPRSDLERTLNMGVGFLVVLPADHADRAVEHAKTTGIPAWLLGEVTDLAEPATTSTRPPRSWSAAPKGSTEERFRCSGSTRNRKGTRERYRSPDAHFP